MTDILNNLPTYIKSYEGPKMSFIIAGGGMEIFRIPQTPGSSKILNIIYVPYSQKELNIFSTNMPIRNKPKKIVSAKVAKSLCKAGCLRWNDSKIIAITASLTTNRPRRGKNEAFVAVGNLENTKSAENILKKPNISIHHIEFPKLTKKEFNKLNKSEIILIRQEEDRKIANFALSLAFGEETNE